MEDGITNNKREMVVVEENNEGILRFGRRNGDHMPSDPDYRFTYRVTHTYCVRSTGPLLKRQLLTAPTATLSEGFALYLADDSGNRTVVAMADITAEDADTDWTTSG